MSIVASPELILRMTKANMGAAVIISDLLILGPHPLFDTCRKLRGLNTEHFIRWADKISTAVYDSNWQFARLVQGTRKSFEERIEADPDCLQELVELYKKVEEFLDRYRKIPLAIEGKIK